MSTVFLSVRIAELTGADLLHQFDQLHSESLSGSEGDFEENIAAEHDLDSQIAVELLFVR